MSIANLNVNILPCIPKGENKTGKVNLFDIHTDTFEIIFDENNRRLSKLYFTLFINPMENINSEKDAEEIFSFDENYAIRIRLTETADFSSHDLDEFYTKDNFDKIATTHGNIKFCRFMRICFFENIPLPPKKENQKILIKVLVKKVSGNKDIDNQKDWILQSIYELALNEKSQQE